MKFLKCYEPEGEPFLLNPQQIVIIRGPRPGDERYLPAIPDGDYSVLIDSKSALYVIAETVKNLVEMVEKGEELHIFSAKVMSMPAERNFPPTNEQRDILQFRGRD